MTIPTYNYLIYVLFYGNSIDLNSFNYTYFDDLVGAFPYLRL